MSKINIINKVSPIVDFYNDKAIFLTGATGLLGMCILQKILFECEDVKTIYVLIKSKHGRTIEERLQHVLGNTSFDRTRKKNPAALKKVIAINGDLKLKGLGISVKDLQTLQNNVSIVFHVAATLNVKLPLSEAFKTNTRGTEQIVRISKSIKQLIAFVYVSTAYCNSDRATIEEKVYKSDIPFEVMHYISENDKGIWEKNVRGKPLNLEQSDVYTKVNAPVAAVCKIGGRPNTYAVSKCWAEEVVATELKNAAIVRPSIITTAWQDPEPGWIYRFSGAIDCIMSMSNGVAKCWLTDPDAICDLIPVDVVANVIIASAWDVHRRAIASPIAKDVKVFNSCSGLQNPITSKNLFKKFEYYGKKHLSRKGYSPFGLIFIKNKILHSIIFFLLQTIPAYVCHVFEYISLSTPRSLQNLYFVGLLRDIFSFFNLNQFLFIDHNVRKLYDEMDEVDKKIFDFDIKKMDWDSYVQDLALGFKKHLLKED